MKLFWFFGISFIVGYNVFLANRDYYLLKNVDSMRVNFCKNVEYHPDCPK
jgi:hypothetical protein